VVVRGGRRGREVVLEVARDGGDIVECVAQRGEQGGHAVLPEPFGGYLHGLWNEDLDHLAKPGDAGLVGERREMDEELRTTAGGHAGPERVGEGEVVDQPAGAWPITFDDRNDRAGRFFGTRCEPERVEGGEEGWI
jgi:hypothetical protein